MGSDFNRGGMMTAPGVRVGTALSIVFEVKYPESGIHSPARHVVLQALVPTAVAPACPAFGAMVGGVAARRSSLPARFLPA